MHILKRRLYKRGSSYEVTIPTPILFGLNLKEKYFIIFEFNKNKWHLSMNNKSKSNSNTISRKLYKRGSSYETTLPLPMILQLNTNKNYFVVFKLDVTWSIDFEEINNAR